MTNEHPRPEHDAMSATCDEWLARSMQGDEAAFEALYRYLSSPLRWFAESYVHAPDIAEEIVQDVFLAVWRGRVTLRMRRSARGYFYVAVRNHALNHLKRMRVAERGSQRIALEQAGAVTTNAAAERIERDELVAKVRRVASALPPRTRHAYILYYEHDLSYAEIGEVMGTAVKTVENQLARALRLICRELDEEGV